MRSDQGAGHRRRLRERFLKSRLTGFHDYEVVELLLTFAITRRDVKPIAKAALVRFGSLHKLFEATESELLEVDGIGVNAATLIRLLKPLAREYVGKSAQKRVKVKSSGEAVAVAKSGSIPEKAGGSLSTLYLNTKNEVLYVEEVAQAYGEQVSIEARSVIESAIEKNAKSVIFVRRLTGDSITLTSVEEEELAVIKSVEAATKAVNITVHDYIITLDEEYISAREEGYL